jgi:NTP pyrophosphatase (non-canonical NTP hydrolase)
MLELEQKVIQFSQERWPDSGLLEALSKLLEEVGELSEAIGELLLEEYRCWNVMGQKMDQDFYLIRDKVFEEAADCNIVLIRLVGLLSGSLHQQTEKKFDIVKDRPPNTKQVYSDNWKNLSKLLLGKENGTIEEILHLFPAKVVGPDKIFID